MTVIPAAEVEMVQFMVNSRAELPKAFEEVQKDRESLAKLQKTVEGPNRAEPKAVLAKSGSQEIIVNDTLEEGVINE